MNPSFARIFTAILLTACVPAWGAEAFRFSFAQCDFAHRGIFYERERGYMPLLNDPLLVRGLLLAGASVEVGWTEGEAALENTLAAEKTPPLFFAGNAAVTRVLLEAGAKPEDTRRLSYTPLYYAPDAESVRLLLSAGARVNPAPEDFPSPIFFARNAGVTEVLLEAGVRRTYDAGMTPLHTARDARTVELLLNAGEDPNARTRVGGYPPLAFARNGEVARALLKAGADPLYKTEKGETLLFFARDADTVRQLLAAGVDGNAVSDDGNTALNVYAAYDGFSKAGRLEFPSELPLYYGAEDAWPREIFAQCELLIRAGADVNHAGVEGMTPLLLAYDARLVTLLLEHGADVHYQCMPKGTAVLHNDQQTAGLRALLSAGASVHAEDLRGRTPLFKMRGAEQVKMLLEAGAVPTRRDVEGYTPLHVTLDAEAARALLEAGADPLAENHQGEIPAEMFFGADTLEVLLDAMHRAGANAEVFLNLPRADEKYQPFRKVNPRYDFDDETAQTLITRRTLRPVWMKYEGHGGDSSDYGKLRVMLSAGLDPNLVNERGRTLLHRARRPETVALLLEHGADPRAADAQGVTPLHMMVSAGTDPESVRLLLEAGADVNAEMLGGITPLMAWREYRGGEFYRDNHGAPLHFYEVKEVPETVKLLLEAGADVSRKNDRGQTPLHVYRLPESVRMLIAAGADVNARDDNGWTPLHYYGNAEVARLLVEAGADVHAVDDTGKTPFQRVGFSPAVARVLKEAGAEGEWLEQVKENKRLLFQMVKKGYLKDLRLLAGMGVDLRVPEHGLTLLHEAAHPDIIRFLVEYGLDVNARADGLGSTPLHLLAESGINTPAASALLEAGADVNAVDDKNRTPLHVLDGRSARFALILLKHGANVHARDDKGRTPLLASAGYARTCELLLEYGADVRATDKRGRTFLHLAAENYSRHRDDYGVIRLALAQGLGVNGVDGMMETPLHLCAGDEGAVRILMEAGANPYCVNLNGTRPLDRGNARTVRIMLGSEPPEKTVEHTQLWHYPHMEPGKAH